MNSFAAELKQRLDEIREHGLYRELRQIDSPQSPRIKIGGKTYLNFSSNDYLGLANHPAVKEAAIRAVEKFGAGSGASRLICGSLAPHHELESALAAFKKTESCLAFSSGYAAAIGAIGALMGKDDIVILDKLVHACIVDAARLSGAKLRVFAHNDLNELEDILRWAVKQSAASSPSHRHSTSPKSDVASPSPGGEGGLSLEAHLTSRPLRKHVLIITESVFSMDGDVAPLRDIVTLKKKYGAWLMVDEAHATGLFGKHLRGLIEEQSVSGEVEIQMGTLGKALGSSGGFICGPRELTDYLVNRARSFIFSTAPVPAASAAAAAALAIVQSSEGESLAKNLWSLVDETKAGLSKSGWPVPSVQGAIIPLHIGAESDAVATAASMRKCGIFVPAIRYPAVARGHARLRLTLTAAHTKDDVAKFASALFSAIPNPQSPICPNV